MEFIIDRAKSHQAIDTQIDRIADVFRKNESSEGSYELERKEYRNTGRWKEILTGDENSDRCPVPSLRGGFGRKGRTPHHKRRKKESLTFRSLVRFKWGISHGDMLKSGSGEKRKRVLFRLKILNSRRIWKCMGDYRIMTSIKRINWELIQI